jgi:hypothetical protein
MANYMFIVDWTPNGMTTSDEKPVGFDNGSSMLCLDMGKLTYEEAVAQWQTLATEQYPNRMPLYVSDMRERAYIARGIRKEDLIVALWEAQYEGKTAVADAIQTQRLAVKAAIPTP